MAPRWLNIEVQPNVESVPAAINQREEFLSTDYRSKGGQLTYQAVLTLHLGEHVKLGDLPSNGKGKRSSAIGLSENGFAAVNGPDTDLDTVVACFWNEKRGLRSLDLGASEAVGIGRRGTIVGNLDRAPFNVFAWNLHWPSAINVIDHLSLGSPHFDQLKAFGMSGNGSIAGGGTIQSVLNAVVLKPTE